MSTKATTTAAKKFPKTTSQPFVEHLDAATTKVQAIFGTITQGKYANDQVFLDTVFGHQTAFYNRVNLKPTVFDETWVHIIEKYQEMFQNLFSLELWHNDKHLLENIQYFVKNVYKSNNDPLELFRLGLDDKVTLDWNNF